VEVGISKGYEEIEEWRDRRCHSIIEKRWMKKLVHMALLEIPLKRFFGWLRFWNAFIIILWHCGNVNNEDKFLKLTGQ
jgi:hypothetical protein